MNDFSKHNRFSRFEVSFCGLNLHDDERLITLELELHLTEFIYMGDKEKKKSQLRRLTTVLFDRYQYF